MSESIKTLNVLGPSMVQYLDTPDLFAFCISSNATKHFCMNKKLWDDAAVRYTGESTIFTDHYLKLLENEDLYSSEGKTRYKMLLEREKKHGKKRKQPEENTYTEAERRLVKFWQDVEFLRNLHARQTQKRTRETILLNDGKIDWTLPNVEAIMYYLHYKIQQAPCLYIMAQEDLESADQPEDSFMSVLGVQSRIWGIEFGYWNRFEENEDVPFCVTGPYDEATLFFYMRGELTKYGRDKFRQEYRFTGSLTYGGLEKMYRQYLECAESHYTDAEWDGEEEEDPEEYDGFVCMGVIFRGMLIYEFTNL